MHLMNKSETQFISINLTRQLILFEHVRSNFKLGPLQSISIYDGASYDSTLVVHVNSSVQIIYKLILNLTIGTISITPSNILLLELAYSAMCNNKLIQKISITNHLADFGPNLFF